MPRMSSIRVAACAAFLLTAALFLRPDRATAADWHGNYFPNVPLITQDGKTVHFYDDLLKGKIVVIDLIYTNCQYACPLETARMAQVQRMLGDRVGKEIFFYSISIDPERDTPQQLKAYAEKFHAGPGWLFLTGKKDDIELISKKLGLYTDPDPSSKDGHTPDVILGNETTGQWIRNSALDNPRYQAIMIGDWLNSWKNAKLGTSYSEAKPFTIADQGQYLFKMHCAACHTVGHGDSVGPDLLGVTGRRDPVWLERFIRTPDKVLAEHDATAQALFNKYRQVNMPALGLAAADVKLLVHYLETSSQEFAKAAAAQPAPADDMKDMPGMKMEPGMHHHHDMQNMKDSKETNDTKSDHASHDAKPASGGAGSGQ
jgi:protein SCO1